MASCSQGPKEGGSPQPPFPEQDKASDMKIVCSTFLPRADQGLSSGAYPGEIPQTGTRNKCMLRGRLLGQADSVGWGGCPCLSPLLFPSSSISASPQETVSHGSSTALPSFPTSSSRPLSILVLPAVDCSFQESGEPAGWNPWTSTPGYSRARVSSRASSSTYNYAYPDNS